MYVRLAQKYHKNPTTLTDKYYGRKKSQTSSMCWFFASQIWPRFIGRCWTVGNEVYWTLWKNGICGNIQLNDAWNLLIGPRSFLTDWVDFLYFTVKKKRNKERQLLGRRSNTSTHRFFTHPVRRCGEPRAGSRFWRRVAGALSQILYFGNQRLQGRKRVENQKPGYHFAPYLTTPASYQQVTEYIELLLAEHKHD